MTYTHIRRTIIITLYGPTTKTASNRFSVFGGDSVRRPCLCGVCVCARDDDTVPSTVDGSGGRVSRSTDAHANARILIACRSKGFRARTRDKDYAFRPAP